MCFSANRDHPLQDLRGQVVWSPLWGEAGHLSQTIVRLFLLVYEKTILIELTLCYVLTHYIILVFTFVINFKAMFQSKILAYLLKPQFE